MSTTYESEALLRQYLLFHYGEDNEIMPYSFGPKSALHFPLRCVESCREALGNDTRGRALDVGCAVGGTTFALARYYEEVIGIDYSHSFIQAAQILQQKGRLDYERPHEGILTFRAVAHVPEDIDRSRVRFQQGDAHALPANLGTFDLILACNLICRLREPARFIHSLPGLTRPGGHVFLTTPFSWDETYTPRENWLGGKPDREDSFHGLKELMDPNFVLKSCFDLPFLIREHSRKYQWSVAQASLWQKR